MSPGSAEGSLPRKSLLAIGLGVLVIAFLIRLWGVGWGLPNDIRNQSLHPDELVVWTYAQQIQPARGDFTPGFYNYGTLYLTLTRVVTDVASAYGAGPVGESESDMWAAVGRYHLWGRVLNCLFGALTAWLVWKLLLLRTNWVGALFGASAAAIAPALVVHSRFQTVDMLATLLVVASFYWAFRLNADDPPKLALKAAAWSGVFAGLSAGTKYSGILALVVLFAVALSLKGPLRFKAMLVGGATSLLAFVMATPGSVLEHRKFLEGVLWEMQHVATGHGIVFAQTAPGWIYHLGNLAIGYGVLLTVLGVLGLAHALRRKEVALIGVLVFALLTYVLIARAEVKFVRYTFPIIPALAVGLGWLMGRAHAQQGGKAKWLIATGMLAVGGLGGGGLATALTWSSWMAGEDPRDQAARYLMHPERGINSVGLVKDPWFWSVSVVPDANLLRAVPFEVRHERMLAAESPSVKRFVPANPGARIDFDLRLLTELNPDAVALTSFEVNDVERLMRATNLSQEERNIAEQARKFLDLLHEHYEVKPTALFGMGGPSVHDLMYIRPEVWIWTRKRDSKTNLTGSSTPSESSEEPLRTP